MGGRVKHGSCLKDCPRAHQSGQGLPPLGNSLCSRGAFSPRACRSASPFQMGRGLRPNYHPNKQIR